MIRTPLLSACMAVLFVLTISMNAHADDGHLKKLLHAGNYKQLSLILCDTVPELKKMPESKMDSSKAQAIKEVPKSKKQLAPVAVSVKPIKIIKPKIIKPVIKIN